MLCGVQKKLLRTINHTNYIPKKPTIGQYIIESLIDKNVNIAFGHKNNINLPISKIAERHDQFNIVFDEYKQNSGYQALTYSKLNNNLGVIINNSSYDLGSIYKSIKIAKINMNPILILSCFNTKHELSESGFSEIMKSITKRTITIETVNKNILMDFESLLQRSYADPAGPVHLNIANNILNKSMEI
jgi:thiamine pyrophosphate-dependent acetolactate synthase large subunit-like protein